jgi:hypothetical protein
MDDELTVHHLVFIDESGEGRLHRSGLPAPSTRSLWVAAAVAVPWSKVEVVDDGVIGILGDCLIPSAPELKGSGLRWYLKKESSMEEVARRVAAILDGAGAHVWICASRAGSPPLRSLQGPYFVKDTVRQLLLERINGYAVPAYFPPKSWMLLWDISEAQELSDFSGAIRRFKDLVSFRSRSAVLLPRLLGAPSHDWGGLQVADFLAHFGLHFAGEKLGLADHSPTKSKLFEDVFMPRVKRDSMGKIVGWKLWPEPEGLAASPPPSS